jgi:heme exporter protein D
MDAAGHTAFIVSAYGAAVAVIAALITWVKIDHRRQRRIIADLETRGIVRRSARSEEAKT